MLSVDGGDDPAAGIQTPQDDRLKDVYTTLRVPRSVETPMVESCSNEDMLLYRDEDH